MKKKVDRLKPKSAVEVKNVTKEYIFHHQKPTLAEKILKPFLKTKSPKKFSEKFTALNNVSFSITQGERVGVIGTNGSGKTTLLKIISNITIPTSGSVQITGRVVSLIDLEAGFHPELTGSENIFMNGLIVGMTNQEIVSKFKQIVDFADIGLFMDAPLYTYSDGMKLRLGLSVAIHSDPDILILDEGIGAGDAGFMRKVRKKYEELIARGTTLISVSHWNELLRNVLKVTKVIWLDKGEVIKVGGLELLDEYEKKITLIKRTGSKKSKIK